MIPLVFAALLAATIYALHKTLSRAGVERDAWTVALLFLAIGLGGVVYEIGGRALG